MRDAVGPGRAEPRPLLLRAGGAWLALALFFAVSFGLNHARGATTSDLGAHDDEAAHAVTGLMVRDWIAYAGLRDPVGFAQDYYLHYPKVAIGQWPPLFYVAQAAWMLVFPPSVPTLLALMSLLSAGTALLLFSFLRREVGPWLALGGGLLLLLLPLFQQYGAMVMSEVPLALLCTAAALAFGRFLDRGRTRDAIGFAALALLAIMTKGNGLALVPLVPLAAAISGRWRRLAHPALWASASVIALACAPWYWLTLPISSSTWSGGSAPTASFTQSALAFYPAELVRVGGFGLSALCVCGAVSRIRVRPADGRWAALLAMIPSVLLVHAVVPSSLDVRHFALLAPALVAFAVAGVAAAMQPLHARAARAAVPVAAAGLFAFERFELPRKDFHGYRAATAALLQDPDARAAPRVFLVASDPPGDGMFVSALALQDRRPGHIVLRGDKVLARSDWLGRDYQAAFATADELRSFLHATAVNAVALDLSAQARYRRPHHDLLRHAVETGDRWELVTCFDVQRAGVAHPGALRIYRQRGPLEPSRLQPSDVLGERLRRW